MDCSTAVLSTALLSTMVLHIDALCTAYGVVQSLVARALKSAAGRARKR